MDRTGAPSYHSGMIEISETLDARGLLCPLPVLKARKRLQSLPRGAVLQVWADDPAAVIDVPHFCNEAGHGLLSQDERDEMQVYLIRKGG
ncbi:sulfurtransferase TusA family protein [Marinibacterium sp. SX1]|uniref:sulfurtransferase TusA family protein n=1 Tax=Marinibacterium sp. SX1 TaxID=3388424 RepID=UPI003D1793EB